MTYTVNNNQPKLYSSSSDINAAKESRITYHLAASSPEGKGLQKAFDKALFEKEVSIKRMLKEKPDDSCYMTARIDTTTETTDIIAIPVLKPPSTPMKARAPMRNTSQASASPSFQKRMREEESDASRNVKARIELPQSESAATTTFPVLKPPSTPMKARPSRPNAPRALARSPFQTLSTQAKTEAILIQGNYIYLTFLASGSFMDVFVPNDTPTLVHGTPNNQLVIKLYSPEHASKKPEFHENCMKNSLKNYDDCRRLNIPVAQIYNAATAKEDCLFIQENIPFEIDINNPQLINQVHAFFIASLEYDIHLDLLPTNLRVRENGEVVLTDFIEKHYDASVNSFNLKFKKALADWTSLYARSNPAHTREATKAAAKDFLDRFTNEFVKFGYKQEWNQEILDTAILIVS